METGVNLVHLVNAAGVVEEEYKKDSESAITQHLDMAVKDAVG